MDRDKLESKLKALSLKNKKLLESISTHLISNPDELEGRLHEHRFLEQKYNELIGFSRDSVEKYEKMQAALSLKQHEIAQLQGTITKLKEEYAVRVDNMERDHRRGRQKQDQDLESCRHQLKMLRKEMAQSKDRSSAQRQTLQLQLQAEKKANLEKQAQLALLNERMRGMEQKMEVMRKQLEQKERVKKFQALEEVQQSLSSFRNQRH